MRRGNAAEKIRRVPLPLYGATFVYFWVAGIAAIGVSPWGATGCSRSVWRIGVDKFGGGKVASFRGFGMVSLVFCNFAQVQRIGWVAIKDLE